MSQTFIAPDGKTAFNDSKCLCGGQWASGVDEKKGAYKYYHKKVGGYYRLHQKRWLKEGNGNNTPIEEETKEVNMNLFGSIRDGILNILPRLLPTPKIEELCKAFYLELLKEENKSVDDEKSSKLELLNAEADLLYKKIAHESKKQLFLESMLADWEEGNPVDYRRDSLDMNESEFDTYIMSKSYTKMHFDQSKIVSKMIGNDLYDLSEKFKKEGYKLEEDEKKMSHRFCDYQFSENEFTNTLLSIYESESLKEKESMERRRKEREIKRIAEEEKAKKDEEYKKTPQYLEEMETKRIRDAEWARFFAINSYESKLSKNKQYITEKLTNHKIDEEKKEEKFVIGVYEPDDESLEENKNELSKEQPAVELSEEEKKKIVINKFVEKYEYGQTDDIKDRYKEYKETLDNIATSKETIKEQIKRLKKDCPDMKKKEIDESLNDDYEEIKCLEDQLPSIIKDLKSTTEQAIDHYLDVNTKLQLLKEGDEDFDNKQLLIAELTKLLQYVYGVRFEIIQVYLAQLANDKQERIKEMDSKRNKNDKDHYQREIDLIDKKIAISQNEFNNLKVGKLDKSVKEPKIEENKPFYDMGNTYLPGFF